MNDAVEMIALYFSDKAKREGNSMRTTCPVCNGHNLVLNAGHTMPIVGRCFDGCDKESLLPPILEACRKCGLIEQEERPKRKRRYVDEEETTFPLAMELLRCAVRADAGKPRQYLKGRNIDHVPVTALMLPAKHSKRLTGRDYPAMVFPMMRIEDKNELLIKGCAVTFLTRDRSQKCAMENPRLFYGPSKGAFVILDNPDPKRALIIGEGVESTLSAMALADLPGIAALSKSEMSACRPPPATEYIIAPDNDPPDKKTGKNGGLEAAKELAERMRYEGHTVRIALPEDKDWPEQKSLDWNDVLARGTTMATKTWESALDANDDEETETDELKIPDRETFMNIEFPKRELLLAPWLPKPGIVRPHHFVPAS